VVERRELFFDVNIIGFEEKWEGAAEPVRREFWGEIAIDVWFFGAEQGSEGLTWVGGEGGVAGGAEVLGNYGGRVFGNGPCEGAKKSGRGKERCRENFHGRLGVCTFPYICATKPGKDVGIGPCCTSGENVSAEFPPGLQWAEVALYQDSERGGR